MGTCATGPSVLTCSSRIMLRYQALGRNLAEGVVDDAGDLVPVDVDVEPHTDPASRTDVRGYEEPPGLLVDERRLHAGRRTAPDRQPTVALVVVEEHHERLLAAREERRRAVAQPFRRLGKGHADLADTRERVVLLPRHAGKSIRSDETTKGPLMKYRRLGRTALRVSELCLGTMNFGPLTTEADAGVVMDRALEHGINFFDTANRYGGDKGAGATESIVGRWFAQGGGRREKVVLATKLFGAMSDWPNDGRLSARHIRMACDDSLRRMQTDHIDLYQMHHVDRTAPWEEVWQAMDTLVQQGKIIYVGSSNFAGWHIVRANEAAARLHTLGLVSEQSHYNLLVRTVELEVLPACREYGVGVIPWSPLSSGLLGGVLGDSDRSRRQSEQSLKRIAKLRPKLERWEKLCADLGEEPAAVALAWLLAQDGVTCPIIGPRTMSQLDGASLRALDITLGA